MGFLANLLGLNWRDRLYTAEFRTSKFKVASVDTGVGRRNVVHQYPFRNEPYVEDLGRDANEFVINGYVIANKDNDQDYFYERDSLIGALRAEGPGILVHPFYGYQVVSLVGKARIVEDFSEGGICRFTMTFVPAGKNRYPTDAIDSVDSMDAAAETANAALRDSFGVKYSTIASLGTSLSKLTTNIQKLYSAQRKIMRAIQGGPRSLISTALGFIDTAAANTTNTAIGNACTIGGVLVSSMDSFLSAGGVVGDFQDNLVEGICSGALTNRAGGVTSSTTSQTGTLAPAYGKSVVTEMLDLQTYGDDFDPITVTSPNSAQDAINTEHVINMGRNSGLVATTQLAVRIDYTDRNESQTILTAVINKIDDQLTRLGDNASSSAYATYGLSVADDEAFIAMQELRKIFVKAMQQIGAKLPLLMDYEVPSEIKPALLLAYEQYKDLDRENEIITRNQIKIPHPGFLPGGEKIEILSR